MEISRKVRVAGILLACAFCHDQRRRTKPSRYEKVCKRILPVNRQYIFGLVADIISAFLRVPTIIG